MLGCHTTTMAHGTVRALALAALAGACLAGSASAQSSEPSLKIVTLAGQGEVYRASTSRWTLAALKAELGPGDGARALVGGRLTLRTVSGQSLRLGARSRLSVLPAGPGADQPTPVKLESGALWVAVTPGSPPAESVEVRTGAVTVIVRGSGVWITLAPDGAVQVRVFHGSAECSGPGAERQWSRTVTAGSEMPVSPAGAPGAITKIERDRVQGDWLKWNEDQDAAGGYGGKAPAP